MQSFWYDIIATIISAGTIGAATALFTGWVNGKVIHAKFDMYRDHTDESFADIKEDVRIVHKRLDALLLQPNIRSVKNG